MLNYLSNLIKLSFCKKIIVISNTFQMLCLFEFIHAHKSIHKEFGNFIIIDHQNGFLSHYYHNQDLFFNKGDKVVAGDIIAKMGNTGMSSGPHLHFEIWKDGSPINPNTFFEDFQLKSDKLTNDEDSN